MTEKTVQNYKEKSPMIEREHNGVKITVTFSESMGDEKAKEKILDILANAYETRLRSADHSEKV